MRRLEIATYNIHRCIGQDRRKDPGRIVAVIREMAPDILALQEVESARAAHQPEFLSTAERNTQVTRLLEALQAGPDHPIVLLGDINEWRPGAYALRRLKRFFGGSRAVRSFPARHPVLALDGIWARPVTTLHGLRVHASPLARVASDHLPVRGTILLEDTGREG